MSDATNKQVHLQMIQGTISRLAHQSASVKRWYMVTWAALVAFTLSRSEPSETAWWLIALLSTYLGLSAWLLDGFYLREERRFRALYDEAREKDQTTFSMRLDEPAKNGAWHKTLFSWSLSLFYLPLIALHVVTTAT
ncbi:hypothetical protein [Candidatus Poriferisodalis sp.]|uniref:hypothetical protein n=1 Tax=Candidatus Poriferisodalis sp. TaxID=3101277 RepID=UPI003B01D03D